MSTEQNCLKAQSWHEGGAGAFGAVLARADGNLGNPEPRDVAQPRATLVFSGCVRGFGPKGTCFQAGPPPPGVHRVMSPTVGQQLQK